MEIQPIDKELIIKKIELEEYLYADDKELDFHSTHESIMFANGWTIKEYQEYESMHDPLQVHATYQRISYLNKEDLKW